MTDAERVERSVLYREKARRVEAAIRLGEWRHADTIHRLASGIISVGAWENGVSLTEEMASSHIRMINGRIDAVVEQLYPQKPAVKSERWP